MTKLIIDGGEIERRIDEYAPNQHPEPVRVAAE